MICLLCITLPGCHDNSKDHIEVEYKSQFQFDNIHIDIKDGYFYDDHKKFIIDENTIGVTIYFKNNDDWESED